MKHILLIILITFIAENAFSDDLSQSSQYIRGKQNHAQFLKQQADERVAYLRENKDANIISTGASLEALEPAAGPTPPKLSPATSEVNGPKALKNNNLKSSNNTHTNKTLTK